MHEFALADAVVKTALRTAEDSGMARVDRVVVTVGELQQIETELFEFSLAQVLGASDPRLAETRFEIVVEPVRFACRACSRSYGRDATASDDAAAEAMHFVPELSHAFVRCPECGSPDFEITAGRGVTLQRVEGSDGQDD
jgi:hydrogenase nickel incorporation protein HypA/HybF